MTSRVVYFVGDGVFCQVLDSQVITPLHYLRQLAPREECALLILSSYRYAGKPAYLAKQTELSARLPDMPVRFACRLWLASPGQHQFWAWQLSRALRAFRFTGPAPIVVHCRNQGAAAAGVCALLRPALRVLLDLRGDPIDEVQQKPPAYRRYMERTLRTAVEGADALNTVSHRLVEAMDARYAIRPGIPRSVIGCCVDVKQFFFDSALRRQHRQALGLADNFVICYCGSMASDQRPDAIADAVAALLDALPEGRFLAITNERKPLESELQRAGVPLSRVVFAAVAHDQVAGYLMAADIGLLLRENRQTNLVASPVKFGEYLRCGVPVLLTPYVGDYSALAASHGIGAMIPFPFAADDVLSAVRDLHTRLAAEGDAYRTFCSQWAHSHLSWEGQLPGLLQVYAALGNEGAKR